MVRTHMKEVMIYQLIKVAQMACYSHLYREALSAIQPGNRSPETFARENAVWQILFRSPIVNPGPPGKSRDQHCVDRVNSGYIYANHVSTARLPESDVIIENNSAIPH